MSIITQSDRRKFSSYQVQLQSLGSLAAVDAEFKTLMHVLRIPSTKTFLCQLHEGLTREERELCEEYAFDLPRGAWAEYRDKWKRARLSNGRFFEGQVFGVSVSFDFVEAELQMILDSSVEAPLGDHSLVTETRIAHELRIQFPGRQPIELLSGGMR